MGRAHRRGAAGGLDPDWACHLARTYLADAGWALAWAADTHRLRRAAVAAVAAECVNLRWPHRAQEFWPHRSLT